MAYPRNYIRFPENCYEPKKVEVGRDTYTIYGYKFRGLNDFYDFLKQNPKVNYQVWNRGALSSETGSHDFAGDSYEKAVEKLMHDMDPGYQEYLNVQKNMRAQAAKTHEYKGIKTIAGGVIDPVAYTTGSPTIYRASRLVTKPKFITIDTQVAYYWGTSKSQVFNRALIITNLIRALEKQGYSGDVNSFMGAENYDEVIEAIFEIKQHGGRTNYQTLYKSLVDVEFFRRLCFRLMEASDVREDWPDGYGRTASESFVRRLLHLKKEDIYFDQPSEMGIRGKDVGEDFINAMKHLNLENKIDIEKEARILKQSVKVLKR